MPEPSDQPSEPRVSADQAVLRRLAEGRSTGVRRRWEVIGGAVALVARSSPRLLALTAVLQVVTALSGVAQVAVAASLVRAIIGARSDVSGPVALLVVLTALTALAAAGSAVSSRAQRVMGEVVSRSVWGEVLEVASKVPLSAYDTASFGERLSRVQEHAVGRPLQVVTAVSALVAGVVGVVGFMVYLVGDHWSLPLLVVLAGVPALLGARVTSHREYRFAHEVTVLYRLRLYTAQLLAGREASKELRAYGFGSWLRERHDDLYGQFLGRLARHSWRQAAVQTVTAVSSAILASTALLLLLVLVTTGRIDVGAAAGAALALRLLASRIQDLVSGTGQIYESALFLEDFHELTGHAPETDAGGGAPGGAPVGPMESLVLEGVGFTYPGAAMPSVRGVDLELHPGTVVAVVGENGSGKTTMTKLVSHLYRPETGRVLWNGAVVDSAAQLEAVRRRIAVLFQDFGRYAFTAADNVGIGAVEARTDEARRDASARRAGADAVVSSLSNGWDTLLAAEYGGQDVSLGQWQRIALARAHFRQADLIILDEPTAALDPRAEARLFADVRQVLTDKAVLLVTHRLTSARTADTIIVMRRGEVAERGDHEELMALGGVYAELWNLQAAGYAVDDDETSAAST